MKFTENLFGTPKEILYNDDYAAFAHQVSDEDIVLNKEMKKIVKAGTPIGEDGKKATITSGKSNVVGILLADCDVTYGARPASLLYRGNLVKNKLPETIAPEILVDLPQVRLF